MKKLTAILLSLTLLCTVLCLASCGDFEIKIEDNTTTVPFEVGEDTAEYTDAEATYPNTATANVKIVAGEDVIYCGTVKVTSANLYASEFFIAALDEKEVAQEGMEMGFCTKIGSYVNDAATSTYWMWQYNGNNPTNFSCNDVHVFEGDYLLFSFDVVSW